MWSEIVLNVKRAFSGRTLTLLVTCVVLLSASVGRAQEDRSPKRGFQSPGSYALSDLESISTTNGNMIVRLPLASLPTGRGGNPGHTLFLMYNSKLWDSKKTLVKKSTTIAPGEEPIEKPIYYTVEELQAHDKGGWSYGYYYQLELINRTDLDKSPCIGSDTDAKNSFIWKLNITFPDGSVHEFRPSGHSDHFDDGFFNVNPNGYQYSSCGDVKTLANSTGMTYYSADGSFMRLEFEHTADPNNNGSGNPWTLYMPNGTKVVSNPAFGQRIYDRNDNYIEIKNNTITDQLGRTITLEEGLPGGTDTIRTKGFGGEELVTQVVYSYTYVHQTYKASEDKINVPEHDRNKTVSHEFEVVSQVILPSQSGGLSYSFGYNGDTAYPNQGDYSDGWGELSSITLPSGARAKYKYFMEQQELLLITPSNVLKNYPKEKELTYRPEYDLSVSPSNTPCDSGTTGCVTEKWSYVISSTGSEITGPDGGKTTQAFVDTQIGYPDSGLTYKTVRPDGSVSEQVWEKNLPHQHEQKAYNWYVRTEFNSIPNASDAPVKAAIKDYDYDKNGSVTAIYEYDWVNYSDIPRGVGNQRISLSRDSNTGRITGIPGLSLKRVTRNTYYNQAPAANSSPYCMSTPGIPITTGCENIYVFRNLNRRLHNLIKSSEIGGGTQVLARTEFDYDFTETKGNLTEQRSWDSVKAPALPTSLSASNAVIVSRAYDQYGNVTLTTDARGSQTEITYGNIAGPNGQESGLYPTMTRAAFGKPEQRTSTQEYDIYTGATIRATDVDNGVSTSTDYDVFGRPILVKAAEGKSEETHTITEYSDVLRRVITRSDLNNLDDKKLVSIQHYDQLGRVRLTRQLEDACSGCDTDETKGIKVQTRYYVDEVSHFTYQLVSNPYRADYSNSSQAASESTMGWSRSKSDKGGQVIEVQTFSGNSLPAPWGSSTSSTGTVLTSYDSVYTTVTDQAGKARKSEVDALGRLVKVFEAPNNSDYNLETNYKYDAMGNLRQVVQPSAEATQNRYFMYDSLSRLIYVKNPEQEVNTSLTTQVDIVSGNSQWSMGYSYYDDGSLKQRTDTRNFTTTYTYDALNRVKTRTYSDGTPAVTYTYDALPNGTAVNFGKGRLTAVGSTVSTTSYTQYDAMGRVLASSQTTAGASQPYEMFYKYNKAGNLISQIYPSGRKIETSVDTAGRTQSVTGSWPVPTCTTKPCPDYMMAADNYVSSISYTAASAISSLKLGSGLWEHTLYNSRLQPTEIGLGASATDSGKLRLGYKYGVVVNGTLDETKNNGNLQSQTISMPKADGSTLTLTQDYGYDELNRLKKFHESGGANQNWYQYYKYDRFGNRNIDKTAQADGTQTSDGELFQGESPTINPANNRINAVGYEHDPAGNLTKMPGERGYIYDAENKQTSYKVNNVEKARYSYDGDGRRVRKVVNGVTTIFVYDAQGRLVAEYGGEVVNNGTRYLTADHLGSTRLVTDAVGVVKERHDYLPFGEEIISDEIYISGRGSTDQPDYKVGDTRQKFTQKERDSETGLDYFNARYYSSAQGRFASADPGPFTLADPQSWNRYSYVQNNPLKFIDPTGTTLILTGDYADYLVRELERYTGYKLERDKKTGVVTIDEDTKRRKKDTSKALAAKLNEIIRAKDADVKIETVKNEPGVEFDLFATRQLDIADYNVTKKGAPEFAAASLGHVLEEYYQAEKKYWGYTLDIQEDFAHTDGLVFEAKVLSDFTRRKEATPEEWPGSNSTKYSFIYTSVRYDITRKSGADDVWLKVTRVPNKKAGRR